MAVVIDDNGVVKCDDSPCSSWVFIDCKCGNCPLWNALETIVAANGEEDDVLFVFNSYFNQKT